MEKWHQNSTTCCQRGQVIYQNHAVYQTYDKIDKVKFWRFIRWYLLQNGFYVAKYYAIVRQQTGYLRNYFGWNVIFKIQISKILILKIYFLITHACKLWIPFYKQTLDSVNKPSSTYYSLTATPGFQNKYLKFIHWKWLSLILLWAIAISKLSDKRI
jgi:hypothetical protein